MTLRVSVCLSVCLQYLEPQPGDLVSVEDGTVMGRHRGESSPQSSFRWCDCTLNNTLFDRLTFTLGVWCHRNTLDPA